jgi:methanogenic corrinoid protein MtbC1
MTNPLLVLLHALVRIRDNADTLGVDGVAKEASRAVEQARELVKA